MAKVEFILGEPIAIDSMIPPISGGTAELPAGLKNDSGIYLIRRRYPNTFQKDNRYMGISTNIRKRFGARQAACFDLGFNRSHLENVSVYVGTMNYTNTNTSVPQAAEWFDTETIKIIVDGQKYDLEHMFIKGVQYMFSGDTITNSLKTKAFKNTGAHAIELILKWKNGPNEPFESRSCIVQSGWQLD